MITTDHAQTIRVLTDPEFIVPPPEPAPSGIGWLRAGVARFANGSIHQRRRRLTVERLDRISPTALRENAHAVTAEIRSAGGRCDVMADIARRVPVTVLARALGIPGIDPAAVSAVATAYPHDAPNPAADRAVDELVAGCGGVADEATAALIGLLVQTCDATAGLIGTAAYALLSQPNLTAESAVEQTLRHDPPVRFTRRRASRAGRLGQAEFGAGALVWVDLTVAEPPRPAPVFGAGAHRCPGSEHAVGLTVGVLTALCGSRLHEPELSYEASPNPRVPARLIIE